MDQPTDILVRTGSGDLLDQTLQQLPGVKAHVIENSPGSYLMMDGCYVVRVFGGLDFIRFAFPQQGYGEIVRELPEPL